MSFVCSIYGFLFFWFATLSIFLPYFLFVRFLGVAALAFAGMHLLQQPFHPENDSVERALGVAAAVFIFFAFQHLWASG
ncbi:efflux transporter protein [Roseibium sp. TrichSKD4]|nr:efflux transporter protein [Roseibium sp. TrichSKD4]